jgi:hypothetical protein
MGHLLQPRGKARFTPVPQNFNCHVHQVWVIAQMVYATELFRKVTYNRQAQHNPQVFRGFVEFVERRPAHLARLPAALRQPKVSRLALRDHPPVHRERSDVPADRPNVTAEFEASTE